MEVTADIIAKEETALTFILRKASLEKAKLEDELIEVNCNAED